MHIVRANDEMSAAAEPGGEEFVIQLTNHQSVMLAYIRSLMPGSPNCRDLLQEVNITLWQKREGFEMGTNFKAWAFQTIRYHMMNHRRKMISQGWLVFDEDLLEGAEWECELGEVEERHQALRSCLGKLRKQDRDLLHHRYATDASLHEFAKATNRSSGTLKAILFTLRASLKKCIEGQMVQSS